MGADWSKAAEHIAHRGITPAMANEALDDPDAVVVDPDYNSESGLGVRTIGFSANYGGVLSVITVEHEGVIYGATAFRADGKDRRFYLQGETDE